MRILTKVTAGYGFSVEPLEGKMEEVGWQDLDSFVYTVLHKICEVEKVYYDLAQRIMGDDAAGVALFVRGYPTLNFNEYSNNEGAHLFDDEIPMSKSLVRDIEKLKEYFYFFNDEPKPIILFSTSES